MCMKSTVACSGNVETTVPSFIVWTICPSRDWKNYSFGEAAVALYDTELPLIQERNCVLERNSLLQAIFSENIFSK